MYNYDIVYWVFFGIDDKIWKFVIDDLYKEWVGFKGFKVKKIGVFGGWVYFMELVMYNII